jgi:hypothetical protein
VPEEDEELDGGRIVRVAQERRATLRAASYCLIAAGACGVASADLIWRAARRFLIYGGMFRPLAYLLAAAALTWVYIRLAAKAIHLRRLARQTSLPDPKTPPDFSTLSDGTQFAKNLEKIE